MQRAAILIGVQHAHTLPELQAVWAGVHEMEAWANAQDINPEFIQLLTDEEAPVEAHQVVKAVRTLVDLNSIDQLLIYFSGHGVNIGYNEYWLLSDAIVNPNEAVNVTASEELARHCGISHVIFISDACRTAADGINAQGITGSVIFPARPPQGPQQQVDLFYGTMLGQPALEIRDVNSSTGDYNAAYTSALTEALEGQHSEAITSLPSPPHRVVQPWPLRDFLLKAVPRRVFAASGRSQTPDARITSRPDVWLSKLPNIGPMVPSSRELTPTPPLPQTLENISSKFLRLANEPAPPVINLDPGFLAPAGMTTDTVVPGFDNFITTLHSVSTQFGPSHYETRCGFKVKGARITDLFATVDHTEILSGGEAASLELPGGKPVSVLLRFDNGRGVVLPAIQDFIAGLIFDGTELVSVNYDPMDTSWRWDQFQFRRDEIERLRAVITASSRMGTFRLRDDEEAAATARKMQMEKGHDPALSVFAGYAYRDQRTPKSLKRIKEMASYQRDDLRIMLFDVAMISRHLDGKTAGSDPNILPCLPLVSQGWALLPAHDIKIPESLSEIHAHFKSDSLWTLYDDQGSDMIQNALSNKEIY